MKTILAPIDFSGITDAVVAEAAILARALNARVSLFTVFQPPVAVAEYAPHLQDIADMTMAGEKNVTRQLAKLEARLETEFVTAESDHAIGSPTPLILNQADKCQADYIVMGSHGHTALYDLLVGSTTHGVLSHAKCPVVIVPAVKQAAGRKPKPAQSVALV